MHARTLTEARSFVAGAAKQGRKLAVCGARHAGGGQQFASMGELIDTNGFNKVIGFDRARGLLEVEPGIRWTSLLEWLELAQKDLAKPWGVLQKQTGNDALTVGGAVCANAHGQGLKLKPLVQDIESLKLVLADGSLKNCSRSENPELFRMVLGGYGLFGLIVSITIRLVPRSKYKRVVQRLNVEEIPTAYYKALARQCKYADWQSNIDDKSDAFLNSGLFSYYDCMDDSTPLSDLPVLSPDAWVNLVCLAHQNKSEAYKHFSEHLLGLSGKVHWPEIWQSSQYVLDYHRKVDTVTGAKLHGTEVLTELYVPIDRLPDFMSCAREDFLKHKVDLIYSTIRFIDTDNETFLPWARSPAACIIFNLHVEHCPEKIEECRGHLRRLIDHAIKYGGRYYLTYHRFASKEQVLSCYPELPELLAEKRNYDPQQIFHSDWYQHYLKMFS